MKRKIRITRGRTFIPYDELENNHPIRKLGGVAAENAWSEFLEFDKKKGQWKYKLTK